MMNNPGIYTKTGVELAQQGRKQEALAYLRYAVTTEPMSPEVWLWLAHVTPDLNEYRHSVQQALLLQPGHPTAVRMQQDLDYQTRGMQPLNAASAEMASKIQHYQRQRRRTRRILLLLNLIVFVLIVGGAGLLLRDRLDVRNLDDLRNLLTALEPSKSLRFAVGGETDAISFQVDVPESWYLADTGSQSWRNRRDHLNEVYPSAENTPNLWDEYQTDLGEVTLNPATGAVSDAVFILETNTEKLVDNPTLPPYLTLVGIQPLPQGFTSNGCAIQQQLADLEAATASSNPSFVKAEVVTQADGQCLYYLEYRSPNSDPATHFWDLRVPVGNNRLAIWQITLADAQTDAYDYAVQQILKSLRVVGAPA